jgi:hypothetical protein
MPDKLPWEKPEWKLNDSSRKHLTKDPFACSPVQVEIRKMIAIERIADGLDKLLDRIEGLEEAAQVLAHGRKE